MSKGDIALKLFNDGYNCAQAIVLSFKDELDLDEKTLKSLSSSFGGGISRLREVCGCISAMAMILGYLYGDYDINDISQKANNKSLYICFIVIIFPVFYRSFWIINPPEAVTSCWGMSHVYRLSLPSIFSDE